MARNVTVNYGNNRVVKGLFQHTACVEAGDSGGANMSGDYAQGITSGAALISGECLEKHGQQNESYANRSVRRCPLAAPHWYWVSDPRREPGVDGGLVPRWGSPRTATTVVGCELPHRVTFKDCRHRTAVW